MIKQYFKQALAQLRQQPLLTTISVLGTALTICLIMVVVMQQQIKTTPFAPESNRNRLLHVKQMSTSNKTGVMTDRVTVRWGCRQQKDVLKD